MKHLSTGLHKAPADAQFFLSELRLPAPSELEVVLAEKNGSQLTFSCRGATEWRLIRPNEVFSSEEIRISSDDPILWDYGKLYAVYGNAPLPDPPRFFMEFFRLVRSELGSRRDPVEYLNWRESFTEWLEMVYSRSYNLLTAPQAVAEGACRLLENQALEYMVLPDPREAAASPPILFEFGRSWVVAQEAALLAMNEAGGDE